MSDELELAAVRTVLVGADGPTRAAWDHAHTALMEAITQDQASGPKQGGRVVRRRPMPRGQRRIPALGLGGLVLAAAIAALVNEVFTRGGTVQPQPAAAAVLVRAADAALASPPARVGPHQYWYQQAQGTYLDTVVSRQGSLSAYVSEIDRWWIGNEHWIRRGRLVRASPAQPITTVWQREILRQFSASPSIGGSGPGFDLPVSYARMLAAPLTTRALAAWVLHAESPPGNSSATPAPKWRAETMMSAIHDILIEPMVPGRLKAGLYRVAATVPGMKMLGLVHDSLGRPALAIGFAENDPRTAYELLFDPVSYALLDDRESVPTHKGTVMFSDTAFIASGVVRRIGQVAPSQVLPRSR